MEARLILDNPVFKEAMLRHKERWVEYIMACSIGDLTAAHGHAMLVGGKSFVDEFQSMIDDAKFEGKSR